MASDFRVMTTTRTVSIIIGICLFVLALLVLPYNLTQTSKQNSIDVDASLFVDDTFETTITQALALQSDEWKAVNSSNFGFSSSPHWLKVKLPKNTTDDTQYLLLNYGLLDHVNLWFVNVSENNSRLLSEYITGDAYPYDERPIKSEKFLFEIPRSNNDLYAYFKISSKGALNTPLEIWSANEYIEYSNAQKLFIGLFFGYMIAMALSNLCIYASTRNNLFVVYAGYISCIAMVVASIHGIGFHYVWSNSLWLQQFSVPIFGCLTMIFIITLTTKLLELKTHSPKIHNTLRNIRYVFATLFGLCFVLPSPEVTIKLLLILLVISTPIIFGAGLALAFRGNSVAKYFCGAWGVLLLAGGSIAMENFGLYKAPINSSYLLMVGAVIEALLLALALAVNVNQQLLMAKAARDAALNNEQEAIESKDELITLQEKNQIELEYSIEERTLELEIALRELSEKNVELEKLSAIDPLTGLMNRRYFDKRIIAEGRRSRRELSSLSVAMLDIDFFKKINDTYGHLGGDHCLKIFAKVLKETIKRPSDVICRYGGEEFVVMLPNTNEEGLSNLLEKIRHTIETQTIVFEGKEISMTVSIGGCSRVVTSDDEKDLIIAFADKLLYQAKNTGRNRVLVRKF